MRLKEMARARAASLDYLRLTGLIWFLKESWAKFPLLILRCLRWDIEWLHLCARFIPFWARKTADPVPQSLPVSGKISTLFAHRLAAHPSEAIVQLFQSDYSPALLHFPKQFPADDGVADQTIANTENKSKANATVSKMTNPNRLSRIIYKRR